MNEFIRQKIYFFKKVFDMIDSGKYNDKKNKSIKF